MTSQQQFPQYAPPPPPPPPTQSKSARPWYRRTPVIATGALLLGLIIGGATGASGGSKSDHADGAGATPTVTQTYTVDNTTTVTATAVATKTVQVRVTQAPPAAGGSKTFSDGTYLINKEVPPGLYKTDGQGDLGSCYWERDRDLTGGLNSIIANDNISGPTTVQILASDVAFKSNGGCTWTKVG